MYSMAGGDPTRFTVQREGEEGGAIDVDLTTAPAIVHKPTPEESFVTSLKRKLSVRFLSWPYVLAILPHPVANCYGVISLQEGNILFSANGEFKQGKSFPARKKPVSDAISKPWFSFHIPFVGSFYSKQTAIAAAAIAAPPSSHGSTSIQAPSPEKESVGSHSSPNFKEISVVSKFEEFERHSIQSMPSVPSLHSLHSVHSHNNSREPRDRLGSGSEDIEAPSLRRFGSSSAHHSLSQSSKGPSWIDRATPSTSFLLGGGSAGGALNPGMLPTFTWSHKKPPNSSRRYEQVDIEAVIAKLEHTGQPGEIHLRMNHDDPGLLVEHVHRTSLVQSVPLQEDEAEGLPSTKGGADSVESQSARYSALDVLEHIEEDIEMGRLGGSER
jgi:hypothetical protein